MTFSSPREVSALKRKLEQVKQLGCRSFSLLFDDIEREMCPADKRAFGSFAHAQVAVATPCTNTWGNPHLPLLSYRLLCCLLLAQRVPVGLPADPGRGSSCLGWTSCGPVPKWCPTRSLAPVNPCAHGARARVCLKRSRPSVSGPSHRVDLQAERRPHQPQL
uniref:GH84 domain-containing protein n=1 Tax=Tetraodon nigroviridis TaxID=99883 RepID=H3C9F9_TETNG